MTSDPASFLPLHPLEFRVLLALAKGPTHGFEIVQRIEEEERYGSIHPSNLYRRIRDLTEAKLIKENTLAGGVGGSTSLSDGDTAGAAGDAG